MKTAMELAIGFVEAPAHSDCMGRTVEPCRACGRAFELAGILERYRDYWLLEAARVAGEGGAKKIKALKKS